jgi:hypothetical protein
MIDSVRLNFRVVNAGVSGETSAGGLRRIDWLLREPLSVLVLELGANDGLRGQSIAAMRRNLQEIIATLPSSVTRSSVWPGTTPRPSFLSCWMEWAEIANSTKGTGSTRPLKGTAWWLRACGWCWKACYGKWHWSDDIALNEWHLTHNMLPSFLRCK